MANFRDKLITKSKPPQFCSKCEMNLLLLKPFFWIGIGYQPLEYGCFLKCENCGKEDMWLNTNFIREIKETLGLDGAREFLGKAGWFGKTEKDFLLERDHSNQPELFDGLDSAY